MSAHTPGPWTAWDRGIGWEVHDPKGWPVNSEHKDTFKEADARLIAAAPELLTASKWVVEAYEDDWRLGEAMGALRAAIAKATGEP